MPSIKTKIVFTPNPEFLEFPMHFSTQLIRLAKSCLDKQPKSRPEFYNIERQIMEMRACFDAGFEQNLEQPMGSQSASLASLDAPVKTAAEVQNVNDLPAIRLNFSSPTVFISHQALIAVRGLKNRQRHKLTVSEEECWDEEGTVTTHKAIRK